MDAAPADLFVVGSSKPVLYAPRGAPTASLRDRLARGLVLWSEPLASDRLVSILLAVLAQAVDDRFGPPATRGHRVRRLLVAVYDVAREGSSGEPQARQAPTPTGIVRARQAAAAGLVGAASIVEPLVSDPTLVRAVLSAQSGVPSPPTAVERSIDGAFYARLLAARLGLLGADSSMGRLLLAGMFVRDLSTLGVARRHPLSGRHPLDAADLLAEIVGRESAGVRLVARHHERPDGTGYPRGLGGAELTDLDLVAAAADALVGALPPTGPAVRSPAEALAMVRFVMGRRFPAEITKAVGEIVAEFGPSRSPQRPA